MPRAYLVATMMVALFSGCYRYAPATLGDLSPETRVRIDIARPRPVLITTDSGSATYADAAAVMGRVAAIHGDTLVLRRSYILYTGSSRRQQRFEGHASYLPDATDRLRRRRLDKVATTIAVVVPLAVITLMLANAELGTPYPAQSP
jgi:hypothetical protein